MRKTPGITEPRDDRRRARRAGLILLAGLLALPTTLAGGAGQKATVGGWAGFVYSDDDRPQTKGGFDAHPWYFYFKARPLEGYRFFAEVEAEHVFKFQAGKTGDGELKLERLYIERNFSTAHNLRAGKFFAPFGFWYRLHWHFLTETLSRPYSFNNAYTPKHQVGLEYFGRTFFGRSDLQYFAWLGDGPDVSGTDERSVDALALGASAVLTRKLGAGGADHLGLTLGFHRQTVGLAADIEESQDNFVAGAELRCRRLELRAEAYRHDREMSDDLSTWYAAATYWVAPRIGLTVRRDAGDDLKRTGGALDPRAASESFGVIWRPKAQVLLKAEYRTNDFDDPGVDDFSEWNVFYAIKY